MQYLSLALYAEGPTDYRFCRPCCSGFVKISASGMRWIWWR